MKSKGQLIFELLKDEKCLKITDPDSDPAMMTYFIEKVTTPIEKILKQCDQAMREGIVLLDDEFQSVDDPDLNMKYNFVMNKLEDAILAVSGKKGVLK